ncbi:hypothetical protein [Niallia circulans]|uniref:hypothetical protein n=1 Tax=Niallia circulans TaxID=1397 RepID=UPI00351200A4
MNTSEMIQGICVDTANTTVLVEGQTYFLFPNGPNYFYVSEFPDSKAHKGCYQSSCFQIIKKPKEEWPAEPKGPRLVSDYDKEKVYKAQLVWRKPGYRGTELKEYFIRLKVEYPEQKLKINLVDSCYFYNQYENGQFKGFRGCFPLHWFGEMEEVLDTYNQEFSEKEQIVVTEPVINGYEQLSLFD